MVLVNRRASCIIQLEPLPGASLLLALDIGNVVTIVRDVGPIQMNHYSPQVILWLLIDCSVCQERPQVQGALESDSLVDLPKESGLKSLQLEQQALRSSVERLSPPCSHLVAASLAAPLVVLVKSLGGSEALKHLLDAVRLFLDCQWQVLEEFEMVA
jgi:hypothetical protein